MPIQNKLRYLTIFFSVMFILISCGTDAENTSTKNPGGNGKPTWKIVESDVPSSPILENNTDDYKVDIKKRLLRVLVSYNYTNYFVVGGKQKGLEYELMNAFEKFLNQGVVEINDKVQLIFISVPFDELIPMLQIGQGDIIASGLTVTTERAKEVAFTMPYKTNINEIVVSSSDAIPIDTINELSGKEVFILSGSSYETHLIDLNKNFSSSKKAPIKIIRADQTLSSEDILQMVNAGIYDYTAIDNHKAEIWSQVLPNIVLEKNAILNEGGQIAWAVRKNNPVLLEKLNNFVNKNKEGTLMGNMLFKRYYENTNWIVDPITNQRKKKLEKYKSLFKKYGDMYGIDWIFLAALSFQESRLNQNLKSNKGAVGLMQIKPSTANDKNVGIKNISESAENNIHAGTKYLSFIRERYFSDPAIDEFNQVNFAIASYNAGPRNIQEFRKKSSEIGLDPNVWFYNVANISLKELGRENVQYVSNINKYYLTYKTVIKKLEAKEEQIKKH